MALTHPDGRQLANVVSALSVTTYGAAGDGVTDDTAAIQACFDAADVAGGFRRIYFPPGLYLMASQAVFDLVNEAASNGVEIFGAGPYVSKILQSEANTTGAIKVVVNGNQETISIHDLSFHSTLVLADGTDNGIALHLASSVDQADSGFGARESMSALIERVFFEGEGINSTTQSAAGVWSTCLRMENLWYPVLRGVNMCNRNNVSGSRGIWLTDCYDPRIIDCYVRGAPERGIHIDTERDVALPSFEGGMMVNTNIVGALDGLVVNHEPSAPSLYEPGFNIVGGHVNCRRHGLRFKYHRQITITGTYLFLPAVAEDADLLPSAIYLERASDVSVVGCQFLDPGYLTTTSNCSVGVRLGANTNGVLVDACVFNTGGIGVHSVAVGVNRVGTNNIYSIGQRTGAWASFTRTLDTVGTLIDGSAGTGWADATGTADRATFDTATVTLPELAERVKALVDDLKLKGILED